VRVNGGYKNSDTFDETTEFNIVHARFGADTQPNLGYCAVTIHRVLIFDEPHNAAQVNEVLAVLSRQTGIQVEVAT
jgi:hypothetical protein